MTENHPLDSLKNLFFEGAPNLHQQRGGLQDAPSPAYVSEFLSTSDGLALTKSFMRIKEPALRRCIVTLVRTVCFSRG